MISKYQSLKKVGSSGSGRVYGIRVWDGLGCKVLGLRV